MAACTDNCTDKKARNASRAIDAREQVARQDLATALARIFVPRAGRRRYVVETTSTYRGVQLTISAPVLDATDIGVLLALQAIAASCIGDCQPGKKQGGLIPRAEGKVNSLAEADSLRCETTVAEIAAMVGRQKRDGRAAKAIRASIRRLMMVTITAERGAVWGATHLITGAAQRGGHVVVALNYRATKAVVGTGQYAAVRMKQWRQCKGDLARVLLHRLAALTTGRMVPVYIDTLAHACWIDPPKTPDIQRYRRSLVRDAIKKGGAVPEGITARIASGDGNVKVTFRRCGAGTAK